MIAFSFEVLNTEDSVDGLSRGHLTIHGDLRSCTSRGKKPDQSMLIFPSIVLLLDQTRFFYLSSLRKVCNFVGVDCSFQFVLERTHEGTFCLKCDGEVLTQTSKQDVIEAIWLGVTRFMDDYGHHISPDDIMYEDLNKAMSEFKRIVFKTS